MQVNPFKQARLSSFGFTTWQPHSKQRPFSYALWLTRCTQQLSQCTTCFWIAGGMPHKKGTTTSLLWSPKVSVGNPPWWSPEGREGWQWGRDLLQWLVRVARMVDHAVERSQSRASSQMICKKYLKHPERNFGELMFICNLCAHAQVGKNCNSMKTCKLTWITSWLLGHLSIFSKQAKQLCHRPHEFPLPQEFRFQQVKVVVELSSNRSHLWSQLWDDATNISSRWPVQKWMCLFCMNCGILADQFMKMVVFGEANQRKWSKT